MLTSGTCDAMATCDDVGVLAWLARANHECRIDTFSFPLAEISSSFSTASPNSRAMWFVLPSLSTCSNV